MLPDKIYVGVSLISQDCYIVWPGPLHQRGLYVCVCVCVFERVVSHQAETTKHRFVGASRDRQAWTHEATVLLPWQGMLIGQGTQLPPSRIGLAGRCQPFRWAWRPSSCRGVRKKNNLAVHCHRLACCLRRPCTAAWRLHVLLLPHTWPFQDNTRPGTMLPRLHVYEGPTISMLQE